MSSQVGLYFLAIIPPKKYVDEGYSLKLAAKEKFGTKASLNSPPHLTLHMPFSFRLDKELKLKSFLQQFCSETLAFSCKVNGWGKFPPKVIFLEVEKSKALEECQKRLHIEVKRNLNLFNSNYKDQVFRPHITIVFRDLKKTQLEEAFSYLSGFHISWFWEVSSIALLKHTGTEWLIDQEFPFEKPTFELNT